jgi:hypothetical protein
VRKVYGEIVDGLVADYQKPRTELDAGRGEFNLRTLLKMAQWAADNQPVRLGGLVDLDQHQLDRMGPNHGWLGFRGALADGPHEVKEIDFNGAHNYWTFDIELEGYTFCVPMSWANTNPRSES